MTTCDPGLAAVQHHQQLLEDLDRRKERCLAAEGGTALLECVRDCLLHGVTAPAWLRDEYVRRFALVGEARVKSWDEAFGRPFAPRARLAIIRRDRQRLRSVHEAVWAVLREDPRHAIDDALFRRAAESPGLALSAGSVKTKYYQAINEHGYLNLAQWVKAMRQRSATDSRVLSLHSPLPVFAVERLNGFGAGAGDS